MANQSDESRKAKLVKGVSDNELKVKAGYTGERPKDLESRQKTTTSDKKKDK